MYVRTGRTLLYIHIQYISGREIQDKLNSFIRQLRWKGFYFDHPTDRDVNQRNFGFRSEKCPLQTSDLTEFESNLYNMAQSLKFRQVLKLFQKQLAENVKNINAPSTLYVPADKTTNIYKMKVDEYNKLLQNNITINFRKTDSATINTINLETKIIAEKINLEDIIEKFSKKNLYHD